MLARDIQRADVADLPRTDHVAQAQDHARLAHVELAAHGQVFPGSERFDTIELLPRRADRLIGKEVPPRLQRRDRQAAIRPLAEPAKAADHSHKH